MPPELANYIIHYGYLTIFILVFVQELGIPNPVPNELILLFTGYLASTGKLNLFLAILTVVFADFIGTSILFFIFYFLDKYIFAKKRKWLAMHKIEKLLKRVAEKGLWGIYVGRLIPYLRGYTSIAAGLLRIKPKNFLPIVFLSALTWSGGYVIIGRLLGKEYESLTKYLNSWEIPLAGIILFVLVLFVGPKIAKALKDKKNKTTS